LKILKLNHSNGKIYIEPFKLPLKITLSQKHYIIHSKRECRKLKSTHSANELNHYESDPSTQQNLIYFPKSRNTLD